MSIQGHPDWLTTELALGDVLLNGDLFTSSAHDIRGLWFVGGWDAVQFLLDTADDGWAGYVLFQWYYDEAGLKPAGSMFWHSRVVTYVADIWPNLGPYLQVQTYSAAGFEGERYRLGVMLRKSLASKPPAYNAGVLVNTTTTLGAGLTNTFSVVGYSTGPALFSFHTDATVWSAAVLVENSSGGIVGHLLYLASTTHAGNVNQVVTIPGFVPFVTITNGDGVTRNFAWTLTQQF